jgi:hypothetical protein
VSNVHTVELRVSLTRERDKRGRDDQDDEQRRDERG